MLLWDHPRIRGDYYLLQIFLSALAGSSPHTRGLPSFPQAIHLALGIIPAYAGTTIASIANDKIIWDHPRIRGDYKNHLPEFRSCRGSSPHTRGLLLWSFGTPSQRGIIPAYAGTTGAHSTSTTAAWDHPRIRGDYFGTYGFFSFHLGSSPHTRGLQLPD